MVLALATGQKRFSASICKLVEKYAEILASQGLLTTAMEYLKLMGTDDLSPELLILRDRIALSSEPGTHSCSTTYLLLDIFFCLNNPCSFSFAYICLIPAYNRLFSLCYHGRKNVLKLSVFFVTPINYNAQRN